MNSNIHPFKALLTVSLIVFSLSVFAETTEDTRWLILKTEPGETQIDPIELIGSLRIDTEGNMEATPVNPDVCSGGSDLACADQIDLDPLDLRVNGVTSVTVQEGASLEFTWNSRGAYSCDGGGTLPGWSTRTNLHPDSADAAPSQRTVSTAGLSPTAYQATLECSNGPKFLSESVSITVNESTSEDPEGCDVPARQPPNGWTRLTTGTLSCVRTATGNLVSSADCREWLGIWQSPFIATSGNTKRFALRSSNAQDYIAIHFNTGEFLSPTDWGSFGVNSASGFHGPRKIMSISKCLGDFSYDAIKSETGCIFATNTEDMLWSGGSPNVGCELEPNTDYYWNILYTETPLEPGLTGQDIEADPICAESGTTCGNVFNPVHF